MSIDCIDSATTQLPRLLARGLDTLVVCYYLDLPLSSIDWEELAVAKERLKQSRKREFSDNTIGSQRLALQPYGRKPYTYVFTNRLFEIDLGEHMSPSCHVRFTSEALWTHGIEKLQHILAEWIASIGCRETRGNVVSRADWAFDYDFDGSTLKQSDFVSRASKDGAWRENGSIQSMQFGTGDIVVRFYDKVAEIEQQSLKNWFHDIWGQKENVWRIEFQIRRERLKLGGIGTLESLITLQSDLLREIATNHTTLRTPSGDTNRSRWPLHPLWMALQKDISILPQTGLVAAIDPVETLNYRLSQQMKSIHGSLKGIAAITAVINGSEAAPSLEEVISLMPRHLAKHHNKYAWSSDVRERMTKLQIGQS